MLSSVAFELDEDQRSTLVHCLHVAEERFMEDVKVCKAPPAGFERLADQLERQAKAARELSDRIENAEYVKVGAEVS